MSTSLFIFGGFMVIAVLVWAVFLHHHCTTTPQEESPEEMWERIQSDAYHEHDDYVEL